MKLSIDNNIKVEKLYICITHIYRIHSSILKIVIEINDLIPFQGE